MKNSTVQENTIKINITDSSEIISPYAEDSKEVINNDFAGFLENSVKDSHIKANIKFEISSKDCDITRVSNAVKNYYSNELLETQHKLNRNLMFSITTFVIGLVSLAITILLASHNVPLIISSALDIFSWVFMWEAVDLFFLRRGELRHELRRQQNFINANFCEKDKI